MYIVNGDRLVSLDTESWIVEDVYLSPEGPLGNMIVAGDSIYFKVGFCEDGGDCFVAELNTRTGIVTSHATWRVGHGGVALYEVDPAVGNVTVRESFGDAGIIIIALTQIDLETGERSVLESYRHEACSIEVGNCSDEQIENNAAFDAFIERIGVNLGGSEEEEVIECGGVEFDLPARHTFVTCL